MVDMIKTAVGRLRIVAFLEGMSFLILLGIAMPLKYMAGMPGAVSVVGMAHGILFVLYVLMAIRIRTELGWTMQQTALALIASVVPFGTFYADAKLFREPGGAEERSRA